MPSTPAFLARIRTHLALYEGRFLFMYLDSVGLVTVGTGTMLADAACAAAIPFIHRRTGAAASPADILAAWSALHAQSAQQQGRPYAAAHFEIASDLRITDDAADDLLDRHVAADAVQLALICPAFDTLPDDARLALFDMVYNLGAGRDASPGRKATGLRAFTAMNAAVGQRDWPAAAATCRRAGVSAARNDATAALFKGSATGS